MKKIIALLLPIIVLTACHRGKYNYDASGTFNATEITVSAEATGRIMQLNIEEGSKVEAGYESGYIDTTQLYLNRVQLQHNLHSAYSRKQDVPKQVAALQQQIQTQKRELVRVERLIAANAANQKQADDINAGIAVLEKQLTAQLTSLKSGNIAIDSESEAIVNGISQIEYQIEKSKIISPINGTVLTKYAQAGEFAAVGKPLFKVADLDNMELRAYITSGQLSQIKLGQKVKVYADYEDKESRPYDGVVSWVAEKAEFTPKTIQTRDERANLVYAIKIAVKNDGMLKIGMYADVKFVEN
jgi:Multidrug resistance efflux pump